MKKSKYSAEQVAFALRQAESGTPVPEICRKMGISEQTFYRWKKKYIGMGVAEVKRLRILEEENKKLKQLARKSALSYKASANSIIVLEDFSFEAPKTKEMTKMGNNLNIGNKKSLFVLPEQNKNIYLSSRNVQGVEVVTAGELSTYKIMKASTLVLVESAIDVLQSTFENQ